MEKRDEVIESEVMRREEILEIEKIKKEKIEKCEGWIERRIKIIFKENEDRNENGKRRRGKEMVVLRKDDEEIKKKRIDRIMKGKERKGIIDERKVIRVKEKRRK